SIEHLTGVLLGCSSKENELRREQFAPGPPHATVRQSQARLRAWQRRLLDSYSPDKAAALFRAFAANGTWQVPTFPIIVHFGFMTPQTDLSGDPRMAYVPQNERGLWRKGTQDWMGSRGEPDFTLNGQIVKRYLELVGKMQLAGVRIMAGTDL